MRSFRGVLYPCCLFVILVSVLVLAQSSHAPVLIQASGLPTALPGVLPNRSETRQGAIFAKHAQVAVKAIAPGTQPSGVNFAPPILYDSGGIGADSLAAVDVNGDGKPDLVVANDCAINTNCESGAVGVSLGNGDGTFQTPVSYGSGGYGANSVAVGDLNGDGKPDIVVSNACAEESFPCLGSSIGVLLGNGDGTFQTAVSYASGLAVGSVAVADVNGDGKLDVIAANGCVGEVGCENNGSVAVLLGNGDGSFQTKIFYGTPEWGANSVAVADVNGDNKLDLIVSSLSGNAPTGAVAVLLGNGDGSFQKQINYDSGGYSSSSVAVADVNGDGKPDLAVANGCPIHGNCNNGVVGVLLGNGDGTFQTAIPYSSGGYYPGSVAVADVNGDGKPDISLTNCGADSNGCNSGIGVVTVLAGNGDGTFQTALTFGTGGKNPTSVEVADVNGDGEPDLLATDGCASNSSCPPGDGAVSVLINTSSTQTSTSLISSLNPSNLGQPVTFTATVTAQRGFYKGTPTGNVTLFDGTTNLGNSSLDSSGVAVLTTSTLSVGTHSVTATYNGDSNFVPSTSPVLSQVVQGAIVQISPSSLNFGNQTVGITSNSQPVTLTNIGNIALTVTIGVTGANSGDFSQTNNCGSAVAAGSSCTTSVAFDPTATGTRTASLTFTDNAPNSPQLISLTGVGVTPTVQFSPTSLTFPTQVVFTTSKPQTVTLTNTGLGILLIKSGGLSGAFGATTTCGGQVNPGASCTASVTFKPKSKGLLTGAISLTDNASDSPQKLPLSGTGTYIQLTPTSLNFGNQPVGTKSLQKKITVSNKGSVAVSIAGISITGTNPNDFAEVNNCGTNIAAGASCFIGVTFTPSAKGSRSASVSISDNGGGSPQQASLAGTGT